MITIIDYGMGNLRSVQKAFEHLGFQVRVSRDPKQIQESDRVVLPGVGAFKKCMENLEAYRLIDPILESIHSGRPFLGICLGMQLLFTESEEFGRHAGLNVISGTVRYFGALEENGRPLKIPHMGWNQIHLQKQTPLFKNVKDGSDVYFVHSYHVVPTDPLVIATTTQYGAEFVSSIAWRNVFATQFHPEKSQSVGLEILKNFAEL